MDEHRLRLDVSGLVVDQDDVTASLLRRGERGEQPDEREDEEGVAAHCVCLLGMAANAAEQALG